MRKNMKVFFKQEKRNDIRRIKQTRGITLVALVITIVILIILAVVAINAVFGDSGVLQYAQDARNYQANADATDAEMINTATEYIDGVINKKDEPKLKMDYENITNYNFDLFKLNSLNNYSIIVKSGGYEKINIPILNCVVGENYQISFLFRVENAKFFNSPDFKYACQISDKEIQENTTGNFSTQLIKDSESHTYTIQFTATKNIMYLNFDLSDLEDNNAYIIHILNVGDTEAPLQSSSTKLITGDPVPYNISEMQIVSENQYTITTSGGYEKINIPIDNCIIGKKYKLQFNFKIDNAQFYNGFSYSYQVSNSIETSNSNVNYANNLMKDTNSHTYTIEFIANSEKMYLNMELSDLLDSTYNIYINEISIDSST